MKQLSLISAFSVLVVMFVVTANAGRFLHITDIHYESAYSSGNDVTTGCYEPATNSSNEAPAFGSYLCDTSPILLQRAFEKIAALHNKTAFDFVFWTGDTSPHTPTPGTMQEVIDTLTYVGDLLRQSLPGVTAFYAIGNHDWFPVYEIGPNSTNYNDLWNLFNRWGWLANETFDTFTTGGYYTVSLSSRIRLISLNTALYITKNPITTNMTDPCGQFAWLNETLAAARHSNETVYIIAHAAPGVNAKQNVSIMYPQYNQELLHYFAEYSDIITAHFYGHEHADALRFTYNVTTDQYDPVNNAHNMQPTATGVMFIAPSICPWNNATAYPWMPDHNPAFRTVDFEMAENASQVVGSILDIQTYWINLNTANDQPNTTQFELEYTYSNDLKIGDSASVDNMWSVFYNHLRRNNGSLAKYISRNSVQAFTNCSWKVNEDCRKVQLCAISDPTQEGFASCLHSAGYKPAHYVWGIIIGGGAFLAVLALMAATCTILSMMNRHGHATDSERAPLVR